METALLCLDNNAASCIVCGSSCSIFAPVGIRLARSCLQIFNFLARHRVFPVDTISTGTRTDGIVCNSCYGIVLNCDEWSFAFNQGVEWLKQRAAACQSSALPVSVTREGQHDIVKREPMTWNDYRPQQPYSNVRFQFGNEAMASEQNAIPLQKQEAAWSDGSDIPLSNGVEQNTVTASMRESSAISDLEGLFGQPSFSVNCDVPSDGTATGVTSHGSDERQVPIEEAASSPAAGDESGKEMAPSSPDPLEVAKPAPSVSEQAARFKDSTELKVKPWANGKVKKMCGTCGDVLAQGTFKAHHRAAHPGQKLKKPVSIEFLRCPSCPYKTRIKCRLEVHLKSRHGVYATTGPGSLKKCPHCEALFKSVSVWENHCMKVHGEEGTFACSKCDRKFLSNFSRNSHERQMHSTKTRICEYCAEEVRIGLYNSHVDSRHKPKRTYTCEHCGEVRLSDTGHKHHLARVHGIGVFKKKGPREKECSECGKKIKHVELYHAHLFLQHGIETAGLKRYKCEQCGEVVYAKEKYKDHLKLHTGVRHVCPDCGYQTRFSGNFHKHRVGVHGKKNEG